MEYLEAGRTGRGQTQKGIGQEEIDRGRHEDMGREGYLRVGTVLGYEVYICHAAEGPDREEAMALYREARENALIRGLEEGAE